MISIAIKGLFVILFLYGTIEITLNIRTILKKAKEKKLVEFIKNNQQLVEMLTKKEVE